MVCSNCKQEGHTKASCDQPRAEKQRAKAGRPPKHSEQETEVVPLELPTEIREKLTKLAALCAEVGGGLGKGHVEAHYQQALCVELQEAGIRYVAEEVMPILYKGRPLGGTCNARLDVMLHSFLPFIFELKAVSKICPEHHWQLVRYMAHKGMPYGAVVNFSQSDKGPLEIQFVVHDRGAHLLYDLVTQTGRPLVDYALALAPAPAAAVGGSGSAAAPGNRATGNAAASGSSSVASGSTVADSEDDWEWNEE
jgi:GxxExxY protein